MKNIKVERYLLTGWRSALIMAALSAIVCSIGLLIAHGSLSRLAEAEISHGGELNTAKLMVSIRSLVEVLDAFAVVNVAFVIVWIIHARQGLRLNQQSREIAQADD